ncbi:MAG: hypothetical protein WD512_11530 [Candidatus Paceibacterota bacterium]
MKLVYETLPSGNLQLTGKSELVLETFANVTPLGEHEFTMELFKDDQGVPTMIEWDVPSLEETEHIGLWFDGKTLTDYDGVFELPIEAIKLIRKYGYSVPRDFEP